MSWDEIAEVLGISASTVKREYASAIEKLETALLNEGITREEFVRYLQRSAPHCSI